MSVSPGQLYGSYEIVASIGAGGMGEVYRARDTNLKRDVALKVLPPAFVADADRLARFRREAEMLAALNHPNIAQVYGLERADGQTAIVMELVEGPTLAERIENGPIPPDEAMAIALQVVAALEAAHDKGIVHRDLKPANVKVREDGTVKVLDFGISKPIDPKLISGGTPIATTPAMTQTGIILGTAAYMSPEQARGKFVDERTDIWAFGCLLFEMLTGQPAFGGEDMMAVLARVIDRDTDLSSIPRTISPAVRHTIRLCLQKDPRKRIADIRDVRLALEGRFESEFSASAAAAASSPLRRRAIAPAGAVALGAALMATIGTVLWPETPAPEVTRFVHVVPDGQRPTVDTDVPVLAVAPDGREFTYASDAGLVRRRLSELEALIISGTSGENPLAPHYTRDGSSLVYGSQSGGSLQRIGVEGGTPVQVLARFPGNGWSPAEDGSLYAALADTPCIIGRVPAEGGEADVVLEDTNLLCAEPTLLPGGRHLLFYGAPIAASEPAWSVMTLSLETLKTQVLFAGIMPAVVDSRYLVYFESSLGLTARAFDPVTLAHGGPVPLIDDVLPNTQNNAAHFRVSSNGTLIYIRRGSIDYSDSVLARMHPDGTLERLALANGDIRFPAISPDGNLLAFQLGAPESGAQIWMHDMTGAIEPRQFTLNGRNGIPSWSPDSEWLLYNSDRGDGIVRVWRQRADGRGQAEPLTSPEAGTATLFPVMAPDGRLAFGLPRVGPEALDIFISSLPDGEPELFLEGPGQQIGLDFAPDGKAFAYASDGEVYVERFPRDGSPLRVSRGTGTAAWPVWSGDGARLAFQSDAQEFSIVEIDTDRLAIRDRVAFDLPIRPGVSDRLFDAIPNSEDWLVVVSTVDEGEGVSAAEIVVVENWIEELKARVPPLE